MAPPDLPRYHPPKASLPWRALKMRRHPLCIRQSPRAQTIPEPACAIHQLRPCHLPPCGLPVDHKSSSRFCQTVNQISVSSANSPVDNPSDHWLRAPRMLPGPRRQIGQLFPSASRRQTTRVVLLSSIGQTPKAVDPVVGKGQAGGIPYVPQPLVRRDESLLHPTFPAGREVGVPHRHKFQNA
jgi:hypothetical protein